MYTGILNNKGKRDSCISTVVSITEEENKEGCSETGKKFLKWISV